MRRVSLIVLAAFGLSMPPSVRAGEALDQGLVALQPPDGGVFLSWRCLATDPASMAFDLVRCELDERGLPHAVGSRRVDGRTCFLDADVRPGARYRYFLYARNHTVPGASVEITVQGKPRPWLSIPLAGAYDVKSVGVGDLDGDGQLEVVIKQPDFNTDPYQKPGYWKRSETTYTLEAYKLDGTLLWTYDMGWAIEAGTWYSPYVVYDVDGDGRAEVYCKAGEGDPREDSGLVTSGPEYLVKLDGRTGRITARTDWLTRDGFAEYNRYQRNFLTVAYLDGERPSLVMQRGTYNLIKIRTLDRELKTLWEWESTAEAERYSGQGSHDLVGADVDGDGRDELVIGAAVIDDDGHGLWTLGMGHPDACHVADILPDRPGLEIFYGFETKQQTGGLCLVDAQTGEKLWTHPEPTRHVHSQGMAADVLADSPGMELYAGERDLPIRWLYSADGRLLRSYEQESLSPRPLWWDGDRIHEVCMEESIRRWDGPSLLDLDGRVVAVLDALGDWREEVFVSVPGELRIFTTTIPTDTVRPCLLEDHLYRMHVASQTSGYYSGAHVGATDRP